MDNYLTQSDKAGVAFNFCIKWIAILAILFTALYFFPPIELRGDFNENNYNWDMN